MKAHNDRRALHGASPLIWDNTLVQHAQVWVDNIAATGVVQHDPNLGLEGENIAVFQRNEVADCTHAVQGWYALITPLFPRFFLLNLRVHFLKQVISRNRFINTQFSCCVITVASKSQQGLKVRKGVLIYFSFSGKQNKYLFHWPYM